ncbi:MAG TPA: biopolymer transporter ExbD [Beijerinckiaceae bacterium]
MSGPLLDAGGDDGERLYRPVAEMNVTPFVDVMLVLLIVFMVTAPMLTAGVPLQLPQARNAAPLEPRAPVVFSLTADGKLFIDDAELDDADLDARLAALAAADRGRAVQIRADRATPHGRVVDLMSRLGAAGLSKLAFVAEPKTEAR